MRVDGAGVGQVQRFSNIFLKTLTEGAVTTEVGSLFQNFTTPYLGGGSHLGVPCRGALLGRIGRIGEKTSSDQYLKGP